jgi:hypothetical protein
MRRQPDTYKTTDPLSSILYPNDIAPRPADVVHEGVLEEAIGESHGIVDIVTFDERLTMGAIVAVGLLMVVAFVYWLSVVLFTTGYV